MKLPPRKLEDDDETARRESPSSAARPDPFARRPSRAPSAAEEDARSAAERARARQPAIAVAILASVLVAGVLVWKGVTQPGPGASLAPSVPRPSAQGKAAKSAASAVVVDAGSARCAPVTPEPFVIGDAPASVEPADADAGPPEPSLAPFAIEIGRAAAFDGGFAVGVLRQEEGGAVASVVTVGPDGRAGKLVKLARLRGDMNPPVVAGRGSASLAAMVEPNASGRAIKLAKIEGEQVTWGPELSEGRDESLAVDLASSGARAVVVWDDVAKDQKRSNILLSTFDPVTMRSANEARPVSAPKVDAESPRLVVRPGGYWLGYLAHGPPEPRPKTSPPPAAQAKGGAMAKRGADDEEDMSSAGEVVDTRWVELAPLDETGTPTARPKAITPKIGHVLGFDLGALGDGSALVAFRDDDTPSGSSGGRVSSLVVRLGGVGEPWVIADEGLGGGVPMLAPGWLAVADISGGTRLASVDDHGELQGELALEPSLFGGEMLAAGPGGLFLARPLGRAIRLYVMRCAPAVPTPGR